MNLRCPFSHYLGVARLNSYKWIINDRGYANIVEIEDSDTKKAATATTASVSWELAPKNARTTTTAEVRQANSDKKETETEKEKQNKGDDDERDYSTEVYGLVYSLTASDEAQLDINEGVPIAYTKEYLTCDFWVDREFHPSNNPTTSSTNPLPTLLINSSSSSHDNSTTPKPHRIDTTHPPTTRTKMLIYIDRIRTIPSTPREEYIYRMNRGISDALGKGVPEGYVEHVMRSYIPVDTYEEREMDKEDERELRKWAEKQAGRFEDESGVC